MPLRNRTFSLPPKYKNQPIGGYLNSDTSSLSLANENCPIRPREARLSSSRSGKADMTQDIEVSGTYFQPELPSKCVERLDHSSKITELHWRDGGERSGDLSLEPSHVGDDQVSLEIRLKVSPSYALAPYPPSLLDYNI
jgi:hypothetical protein